MKLYRPVKKIKSLLFTLIILIMAAQSLLAETPSANIDDQSFDGFAKKAGESIFMVGIAMPLIAGIGSIPVVGAYMNLIYSIGPNYNDASKAKLLKKKQQLHYLESDEKADLLWGMMKISTAHLFGSGLQGTVSLIGIHSYFTGVDSQISFEAAFIDRGEVSQGDTKHFLRYPVGIGFSLYPQAWFNPNAAYRNFGIHFSTNQFQEHSTDLSLSDGLFEWRIGYVWNHNEIQSLKNYGSGYKLEFSALLL